MLPEQRRQRIVTTLGSRGMVRADDLATQLEVSLDTIRRDLNELERRGELTRVYGGATPAQSTVEPPYDRRRMLNLAAKRAIARFAARLVKPQQTVIYDVGTTVTEVVRALPLNLVGQALTNSGYAARELARRGGLTLHVAGGDVRPDDLAASGEETEEFFTRFYADVAFLAAGGVHPQAGLTDFHPGEIAVRRHMLARSIDRYVLADSSKLGRVALRRVCDLSAVSAVITDSGAPRDVVDALTARGVRVHIARLGDG